MTRPKRIPGEKPLFWTGSSKDDLLAFPEAVIDEIGTALRSLAGNIQARNLGEDKGQASLKWLKITAQTPIGRSIP
jgi:phage-related protein